MLTSGAFEKTPLRRSLLMEGEIKDERDTIKDALNMLERDGFIELRKERDEPRTRGGIPVCVFPGEKLRTP